MHFFIAFIIATALAAAEFFLIGNRVVAAGAVIGTYLIMCVNYAMVKGSCEYSNCRTGGAFQLWTSTPCLGMNFILSFVLVAGVALLALAVNTMPNRDVAVYGVIAVMISMPTIVFFSGYLAARSAVIQINKPV